jgi:hypothetical protein
MRLFKFALPVLFAAGLALLAARAWTDRADAASRSLLLEHARNQFSQRAAVARTAPDPEAWRADLRALLRGWFAEQADIGNRFPMLRGQPAPFVPPPPRGRDVREFQELAEKQIGAWREGRIDLLQTSSAQGLRIDLLRVAKAPQSRLAVDVAVWGAPEEIEAEEVGEFGKEVQRVMVPLLFKGLSLRFLDNAGRIMARWRPAASPRCASTCLSGWWPTRRPG